MDDEERDVVEFTDEEGNTLLLEMLDSFFYNGEEFAVLSDAEDACDCEDDCDDECEHEHNLYIMKIEVTVGEDGEEMEEFIPVEESQMEALIEIVQTRFFNDDEDDEEDEEDEEEDEEDEEEDDDAD